MVWCAGVPTVLGGDGGMRAVNLQQYAMPRKQTFKKNPNKTKGENRSQPFKGISFNHPPLYGNNNSMYRSIQVQHSHPDSIFIPHQLSLISHLRHSDISQTICCINHHSKHRLPITAATSTQHTRIIIKKPKPCRVI